jgi:hypothetical protein
VRDNVRRLTDTRGTNALVRHPNADLDEYINLGYAALHRKLSFVLPDQRFLGTDTISTSDGTAVYPLPADFEELISIDLTANGQRRWMLPYEMNERPALASPNAIGTGVPVTYREHGSNIEILPTPNGTYTITLFYKPNAAQFTADGNVFDTISRLDDYVIAYASKKVAVRDKNWGLANECRTSMAELDPELEAIARTRDRNAPSRIVDEMALNRFGRRPRRSRWLR